MSGADDKAPLVPDEYLGDGVYASFDGYHIWLAANHHENKVIALEPQVFAALERYRYRVTEAMKASRKEEGA